MSDPIEDLYCADCRQRMYVEREPMLSGSSVVHVNGVIHRFTPGYPAERGVTDRNGNPVDV